MPSSQPADATSLLADIDEVLTRSPHAHRIDALRRVTDLFVRTEPTLTGQQAELFDAVFQRLVDDIEAAARIELSERIAPLPQAPHGVVRGLALDPEIKVAEPVLRHARVLRDDDLISVAETHGNGHMLAIARRDQLAIAVTDVLVERGDREVVRTAAANDGATFSRAGFHRLIDRSKGDAELQETLGTRPDLPGDCYPALLAQASETVIRKLSATRVFHDAGHVRRVTHDAADRLAAALIDGADDLANAMAELQAMRDRGQLDERLIRDFARRRQFAYVLAGISLLCDLGLAFTKRLLTLNTLDPLVVVAKANGLGWLTLRDILQADDARSANEAAIAQAFDAYSKMSRETARRIIRFWQERDPAMRPPAA
ncbi:DUF2336 domain-containing protein [Blastochloris viridis]|uniref:DUF2336 domain-containing protein n=1 Tax=Blastochloris viridis TaxID=1079 RepID=A0A0H5BNP1_BLAVI|nr:DUF2336 domain-containing protein [Blastochloris viridis]ALK08721.1 hypothetical protein BVIR_930 [Blastochloris viridis]BAR97983.1 hypothetical protein BV133_390 [Blastochloris viridis]CUU41383.1 hypothetical protein BVIRIDIS_03740 [Blastochloris viridis]